GCPRRRRKRSRERGVAGGAGPGGAALRAQGATHPGAGLRHARGDARERETKAREPVAGGARNQRTVKLVTYNIQFGLGRDNRYDLARIASEVSGADVIALQEVERF